MANTKPINPAEKFFHWLMPSSQHRKKMTREERLYERINKPAPPPERRR